MGYVGYAEQEAEMPRLVARLKLLEEVLAAAEKYIAGNGKWVDYNELKLAVQNAAVNK